jgi:hypothetical protein
MQEYQVEITETLSRIVTVEAEDEADACSIVEANYSDESTVLDFSDFQDVEFEVV